MPRGQSLLDYLVKNKIHKRRKTMDEITIQITLDEYRDLVKKAAIIEAVTRYVTKTKYVTEADLKIILDIQEPATMGVAGNE
jgi:hypothetical protein